MRLALSLLLILASTSAAFAAASDPRAEMRAIDDRARREKVALAVAWLRAQDLTPPAEVSLGADPRESERKAAQENRSVRAKLLEAKRILDDAVAKPEDREAQERLLGMFGETRPNEPARFVDWLVTYRSGAAAKR